MTATDLGSRLLYRTATGLERALADVDGFRITDTNVELIQAIWDPWTCPLRVLSYLAWAMGVEYWNDDWSETTKRAWVAYQLEFKSTRGTRKALEVAVDYAGRDISPWGYEVTKVMARPQKVFSGPSLTREQREAWLARLPQVRVWRINEQGTAAPYKSFYNSHAANRLRHRRFHLGGAASIPSDAITRLKRRARWIEHGVETDIHVSDFGSYFQLHKAGVENGSVFSGRPFGLGRHYLPSTADERLITIEPRAAMPWRSANTPSMQAVTSEPERVTVHGTRGRGVFCDTPLANFFVPTTAPYRIYQRYAVLDPTVRELRRPPTQFMGVGRYGFPAFTARVHVEVRGVIHPKAAGFGYLVPGIRFFMPHDGRAIEQVKLAAQGAKALRDRILLRTGPEPKFLAGEKPVMAEIDTMPAG
ncbi:phage tail protein I [Bradyrhizobium paxllaeri]|uniref:phage tail protein I n=1 Tax=Bradyrhizobium paxllaeri TaxID=190148 RepID=UPI000810B899|nr:phage tail protein I [Bradyrhizobium paxllaeri]